MLMIYRFNQIELDTEKFTVTSNGELQPIEPRVFNLITFLVDNKDKIVSRDELLKHVWQERLVSDTSINNTIKSARQALGDDGKKQQVIKTIHSRGYQFIAELETQTPIKGINENAKQSGKRDLLIALTILPIAIILIIWSTQHRQNDLNKTEASPGLTTQKVKQNTTPTYQTKAQKAIAVLPFANSKPNKNNDYLQFALANQIITDLNYLKGYSVRPASSIRKYQNQVIDTLAIGNELKVDYVISGNYLIENNIIRLNIEMIELKNQQLVWRESLQVNYSDTFALQDMVAQKVSKALNTDFRQNFLSQKRQDFPNSPLAFEYYLRGIAYPQSNKGHKMAVEMLQKSIDLDPNFAPSYAHIGSHRKLLEQHGRVIPHGMEDAEWYYNKALELNPEQLEALSNLSILYTETNRSEEAMLVIRKMLAINPDDAYSHFSLGYIYRYAGMLDEAISEMETALAISPNNNRFRSIISTYISAGQYDNALSKIYLDPGDYGTGYSGIIAYELEEFETARARFNKVLEIDPNGIWGLISQVYLSHMEGQTEQGLKALSKMVVSNITDSENMYYFATFYALLDQKEESIKWLKKAVDAGYFNYPYISKNPVFNFIRDDIRFISTLKLAKEKHDAFRKKFLQANNNKQLINSTK